MNKIQEEHAKFQYDEISVKEASNHESVTLKHMKGFNDYVDGRYFRPTLQKNDWHSHDDRWKLEYPHKIEEIIEEYIKQL